MGNNYWAAHPCRRRKGLTNDHSIASRHVRITILSPTVQLVTGPGPFLRSLSPLSWFCRSRHRNERSLDDIGFCADEHELTSRIPYTHLWPDMSRSRKTATRTGEKSLWSINIAGLVDAQAVVHGHPCCVVPRRAPVLNIRSSIVFPASGTYALFLRALTFVLFLVPTCF